MTQTVHNVFCFLSFPFFFCIRVKLYAVFQGLREEGFDLSAVLASEFVKRCQEVSNTEEKPDRHVIQKLLKTGMSLGKASQLT